MIPLTDYNFCTLNFNTIISKTESVILNRSLFHLYFSPLLLSRAIGKSLVLFFIERKVR